jgi:hypothetical protein
MNISVIEVLFELQRAGQSCNSEIGNLARNKLFFNKKEQLDASVCRHLFTATLQ